MFASLLISTPVRTQEYGSTADFFQPRFLFMVLMFMEQMGPVSNDGCERLDSATESADEI